MQDLGEYLLIGRLDLDDLDPEGKITLGPGILNYGFGPVRLGFRPFRLRVQGSKDSAHEVPLSRSLNLGSGMCLQVLGFGGTVR